MTNLLVNPGFSNGFTGWKFDHGHWSNGSSKTTHLCSSKSVQCDRDLASRNVAGQWPLGAKDRLWQDVVPPAEHSAVVFTSHEIQHHENNRLEIRIYGLRNGVWQDLWSRLYLLPDVPKASTRLDWRTNVYTIPVEEPFEKYRLEYTGEIFNEKCGWKSTCSSLSVI